MGWEWIEFLLGFFGLVFFVWIGWVLGGGLLELWFGFSLCREVVDFGVVFGGLDRVCF